MPRKKTRTPESIKAYQIAYRSIPEHREKARLRSKSWMNNPENKERHRRYKISKSYGLSEPEYVKLIAEQSGQCAICKSKETNGRGQNFHVDHCHTTGRIRGLLCNTCNHGLGCFKDNPELLQYAINYILKNT